MAQPKVFFDMTIGGIRAGRIVMELYPDIAPRTAKIFLALCTIGMGVNRGGMLPHFKGSSFHCVIPNLMCQGGEFTARNGTGGQSIHGSMFANENFINNYTGPGILSMLNDGPGTKGSEFFIWTVDPELLGSYVVFGQVVEGMDVLKEIQKVGSSSGNTSSPVVIADCGELFQTTVSWTQTWTQTWTPI